jgi:hypothetical protein
MSLNTILATAPLTTTNYILKATGTTIGNSLIFDNGTNVGIGNTNTTYKLDVSGTGNFTGALTAAGLTLTTAGSTSAIISGTGTNVYSSLSLTNTTTGYGYDIGFGGSASIAPNSFYIYGGSSASVKFLINSSGNVGIGTSSPQINLNLLTSGTTFSTTTTYSSSTSRGILLEQQNGLGNNGNAIWFNNSGLYSAIASTRESAGDWGTDLRFYTHPTVTTNQYDVTERMRITSGGDLLIGATSIIQSAKVLLVFDGSTKNARVTQTTVGGTGSNFDIFVNSANGVCGYIQQNGTTTVNYSNSSDYRLKENVLPIQNAIDRLSKINAVTYTWKDTDNEQGEGFIAHELQEVVPLAVTGIKDAMNQDGTIKAQGIDYAKLTPLLVAAVQELSKQNDELSNRLIKLESK